MKLSWWKILCIVLLLYTVVMGFLGPVPRLAILNESIRNLYFHVPVWFAMMAILGASAFYSVRYLRDSSMTSDIIAVQSAHVGILLGALGLVTGSVWARFTWGAWWVNDPKLNGAAIGMLIYCAYLILRGSLEDEQRRARISAIYYIFAFSTLIPLLFILPRMTDSLHPGNGGNPGFSNYDLDNNMRTVFYPAVIGWILLGVWLTQLGVRIGKIQQVLQEREEGVVRKAVAE